MLHVFVMYRDVLDVSVGVSFDLAVRRLVAIASPTFGQNFGKTHTLGLPNMKIFIHRRIAGGEVDAAQGQPSLSVSCDLSF